MKRPSSRWGPAGVPGRCALGVGAAAIAVALQLLLWSEGFQSPFMLVYAAILLAAWWGGWQAGVTAIVTSAVGVGFAILPPNWDPSVARMRDATDLVIFIAVSGLLVYFADRTRRALHDAEDARDLAEAANAARETMIAIVAHDLRNPMQTIGLNAALLTKRISADDGQTRSALDRLERSAARARRLVDNIIDSARLEGQPLPLEKGECSLAAIVDETLSVFEPLAEARALRLERPAPEDLAGTVVCDKDRIVQVLTILVGNAFQYTARGGTVILDAKRTSEGVRFEVTDTGAGMTKDELAHAFERLWHGAGPGHGSGLGLWIAEALVEAHGGHITPRSEAGKGTSMSFVLPSPVAAPGPAREFPLAAGHAAYG